MKYKACKGCINWIRINILMDMGGVEKILLAKCKYNIPEALIETFSVFIVPETPQEQPREFMDIQKCSMKEPK